MLLITFLFYLQTLKQLKIDITLVVVVWGFNVRLTYWGIADLVVVVVVVWGFNVRLTYWGIADLVVVVVVVWGFNVRLTYWGIADLVVRLSSFNE